MSDDAEITTQLASGSTTTKLDQSVDEALTPESTVTPEKSTEVENENNDPAKETVLVQIPTDNLPPVEITTADEEVPIKECVTDEADDHKILDIPTAADGENNSKPSNSLDAEENIISDAGKATPPNDEPDTESEQNLAPDKIETEADGSMNSSAVGVSPIEKDYEKIKENFLSYFKSQLKLIDGEVNYNADKIQEYIYSEISSEEAVDIVPQVLDSFIRDISSSNTELALEFQSSVCLIGELFNVGGRKSPLEGMYTEEEAQLLNDIA